MKAVAHLALFGLGLLIGCTGAQPLAQLPQDELIVVLQERLAVVRAAGAEGVESFPHDLDLAPLVGLRETEVIDAFGEPTFAVCGPPVHFCMPSEEVSAIVYSFYRLPPTARGGGTELILWLDEGRVVREAEWEMTQ